MKLRTIQLLITFQLMGIIAFAGSGSVWPSVEYSYVKAYIYNLDGKLYGHHSIIKEGKLDKTVVGEGIPVSEDQLKALDEIFSSGPAIDILEQGLSECFIPRHALVYYDKDDKPVAWMAVCFECDGIRFYSPSYPKNHFAVDDYFIKKAEEKLGEIQLVFAQIGFRTDYSHSEIPGDTLKNEGSMFIKSTQAIDSIFKEKLTLNNYTNWVLDTINVKIKRETKITAGGDRYSFVDITKGTSLMIFSGNSKDVMLEKALIYKNDIRLSPVIRIGMTMDDVQNIIGVYDGLAHPEFITIEDEKSHKKIEFHFLRDVVDSYKITVINW